MIEAILLGAAQDGGVPQADCHCPTCAAARADPALVQHPVCLGLVDHTVRRCWLIDATPAFPAQLHALKSVIIDPQSSISNTQYPLSGILLTHAHIGHYTGLIHLGREVMNTDHLPVYCTPRMASFLRGNAPWSGLVTGGNIDLIELEPGRELALTPAIGITPISVPHRDEYSDTVTYLVRGPKRSLLYCPDIDGWDEFDLVAMLSATDIALLDGTFFSPTELPGRDLSQIPHPLVTDTVTRYSADAPPANVIFIHLNHSNPLWRVGQERAWLARRGFRVGKFGQHWAL